MGTVAVVPAGSLDTPLAHASQAHIFHDCRADWEGGTRRLFRFIGPGSSDFRLIPGLPVRSDVRARSGQRTMKPRGQHAANRSNAGTCRTGAEHAIAGSGSLPSNLDAIVARAVLPIGAAAPCTSIKSGRRRSARRKTWRESIRSTRFQTWVKLRTLQLIRLRLVLRYFHNARSPPVRARNPATATMSQSQTRQAGSTAPPASPSKEETS